MVFRVAQPARRARLADHAPQSGRPAVGSLGAGVVPSAIGPGFPRPRMWAPHGARGGTGTPIDVCHQRVPSAWPEGLRKFSKIGWRNAPRTPPKRARRASDKRRPGQAGCGATVIVISPPDVLLTGSAYDFTRGLAFCLGPGLACRAAPDLLPLALLPFAALPSDRATPSRRPNYRSESEPAWAEVGAARRARASGLVVYPERV